MDNGLSPSSVLSILNISLSVMALCLFAISGCLKKTNIFIIPRSLRTFFTFSIPPLLIFPFASILAAIFSLTNVDQIFVKFTNILLTFIGHYFRIGFFLIFIERLFAIIFFQTFEKFTVKRIGVLMFLASLIIGFFLTIPTFIVSDYFIIDLYVIVFSHLIATILYIKLLLKYSLLHRSLLFNPCLKGRYQIIENIRILRKLKLYIFIILFLAPIAPIIEFSSFILTGETFDLSIIISTGYNCCLVLCLLLRIIQIRYMRKVAQSKENGNNGTTVTDADTAI